MIRCLFELVNIKHNGRRYDYIVEKAVDAHLVVMPGGGVGAPDLQH